MDDDTTWAQFWETSPSTKTLEHDTRSHDPTQQTFLFWFVLRRVSSCLVTVVFEFHFWELFCTKGLLELNTHSQPKVSVLFCFVRVCQLNVITDPTALRSIWYLIGRFASSIWRCCLNYFKTLVFSFISFFALGAKLQWKAVFNEVC